jgi:hypothetical protein
MVVIGDLNVAAKSDAIRTLRDEFGLVGIYQCPSEGNGGRRRASHPLLARVEDRTVAHSLKPERPERTEHLYQPVQDLFAKLGRGWQSGELRHLFRWPRRSINATKCLP